MSTLADSMTDATAELKVSRIALDAAADLLRNKAVSAQAAIDLFRSQTVRGFWVDPINGNDANDGSTAALAKRTVEAITASPSLTACSVLLLGDYTFTGRATLYGNLEIIGARVAGNARGWEYYSRNISFLGEANGSPNPDIPNGYCAGYWLACANLRFSYCNFRLPVLRNGLQYTQHFLSGAGTTVSVFNCTLTADGAAAGSLFGADRASSSFYFSGVLGTNAPGHVLDGVAAGGNPNTLWNYKSNLTAA